MEDKPLHKDLHSSAARFAQSGLRAFLEEDSAVFLLHAATALEQLAKAFLASIHGSLIAANDFDSLLHGCEQPRHARKPRSRMKTIAMREALDRAGQVIPAVENLRASLQLLADVRNGVVHAGQLEPEAEASVLIPFLRACDHLLAGMPQGDRASFWGDFLEIVDARLSESTEAAKVRVIDAIAVARMVFEERYSSMDSAVREAVLSSIEEGYDPTKYEEELVGCPACARRALVQGSYDVDWEADWDYADGEAYIAGAYPVVTFSPGRLECRACGLSIEGEEELSAAEVPPSWKLEDVDPEDFYELDYDWDDYRE